MGLSIKLKIILITFFIVIATSFVIAISMEKFYTNLNSPNLEKIRQDTFFVIGTTFFVMILITIFFSYKLFGPVDELIIGTQLVSQGRLDHKIKKKSNDEIGRLVDSFNKMVKNLKTSQEQKSKLSNLANVEKQKAELIIDSMAVGVIVTDSEHKIVLFNSSAEDVFEMKEKDVVGKHIVNLLKQFKIEKIFQDYHDIKDLILPLRTTNIKIHEVNLIKSEKIVLKASIAPLKNESNIVIGTIAVFEDITKIKELDEMKTEFVSTVSHELRTPLTSIKGYAALLEDGKMGVLDEKQQKAVEIINKESDRLTDLINDILDLSKLETGKAKSVFVLNDIVEAVNECHILQIAKQKGIFVNKIVTKNIPKILFDKPKIIQVFNNILSNAIKFTKAKGKITIKISNKIDHIVIDITDTGVGIPKKDIPKLFNKFYQVESHLTRNQGGTGLGLTIVKEIIGLHHGLISVKSILHKGTTVSFALPKHPISEDELKKCWENKNCKKIKCPAYQINDKRCWLYLGTQCKKNSKEPCFDKIEICSYCKIYQNSLNKEEENIKNKK
ncbi:PAS domain-containing protein [Candidatus Woesearchaeota archaeon]|nr:PAS domain-containing protein [Candidatus Woesearchaeota archaeon]